MNPLSATPHPAGRFELSPIKAMELAAARIPGVVSLAQGIPSFRTPARVIQYAQEKIAAGLCDKYSLTTGLVELREEIALSLQGEGMAYDPETEILATAGSIEGITASLLAFTQPGDEVLLPSPSYTSYVGALSIAGCIPKYVALDEEKNFDFHVEKIERAITGKTTLLLYCSPNNPTGTLFSEDTTRELVRVCLKHNLTILIDEVYKDFRYVEEPHFSPALIPEARKNVIRACSFSKAYAMTGWRVGFLHGDKSRISRVVKFHDAMVTCAPVPSQYAAIGALRYGDDFLEECREEFRRRRDYCITRLDELSQVMDYQLPRATYFVFPRIKDVVPFSGDSHRLAYDILEKVRVATVPGSAFGPSGESHLRINFGREMSELEEGFSRLQDYFFRGGRLKSTRQRPSPDASPPVKTRERSDSLSGKGVRALLACASRRYLKRNTALVIGVAGMRGKTTVKRTLVDLLGTAFRTRGNILSYNTETGLPLSILRLRNPDTSLEKIRFLLELFGKALWGGEKEEILVLEYGVRSPEDARTLLDIAVPDWLILSGIEAGPHLDYATVAAGVDHIASALPPDRVMWAANDPHIREMRAVRNSPYGIRDRQLGDGFLSTTNHAYPCSRETVGISSRRALIFAVTMAELLDIPQENISHFLQG